jgi:hypothetical protein
MSRDGGSSKFRFSERGLVVKWKVREMIEGRRSYKCQVLVKFEIKCVFALSRTDAALGGQTSTLRAESSQSSVLRASNEQTRLLKHQK